MKYKSIDLFAGIGGIRLGFDNAFGKNIETVFVSEWDEPAQKTYKANFNDPFEISGDITIIKEEEVPSFDICLAGFPCFVAGTKVIMADGLKEIQDIVPGDSVCVSGKTYKVLNSGKTGTRKVIKLTFDDGFSVNCTENHLFMTNKEPEEWVKAVEITPDIHLLKEDGTYSHVIEKTDLKEQDVFDIEVEGIHRFCLENGNIVHNCQAFSMAGKHGGFNDDYKGRCRGTLFQDVVRICEYHKPKVIFCENVKGLTIHDHGRTFEVIRGAFEQIGYKVFFKILNSKDFGVPQNRERIYLVCFRNDIAPENFAFPEPTGKKVCIRDIMDPAPVPSKYYLSDVYMNTLRAHKARHEAAGHGFGYVVRDIDGIAGTIVCGGMGREGNLIKDDREHSTIPTTHIKGNINEENIRKMTPREWARLQGFPDSYNLVLADTHLYKQFGNSVTVNVIEAIANNIREVLNNNAKNKK